ncbi:MAG: type II toxin-antitoxin system RelE/ParE family toxin [Solobacterium sp.]|nr:type II toxin-antitoxin system RelE/ParE family toxin [Solobacterium sp.]
MAYPINITPDAEKDLKQIKQYIARQLGAPSTALAIICALRSGISDLANHADSIMYIPDEPYHTYKIKRTIVRNYYIYFRVDKEENTVHILNVIYSRRDQKNRAKSMKLK